ncbi:MBL fold hydrolase, partial [Klebsiella oxytoca]
MLHEQSPTQMMSYILQTGEGKLVVIDGGTRQDAGNLLETLIRLGGPEPTVELWLLTHPHLDHV